MNKSLDILKECNQFLMQLFEVNKIQIHKMKSGDFESLEVFIEKRQALLEMLDIMEEKLDVSISLKNKENISEIEIIKELNFRKEILNDIFNQEIELNKMVEKEKQKTILELNSTRKSHKAVSAYKSGRRSQTLDRDV